MNNRVYNLPVQRGTILKHRSSWVLRYYDTEIQNGVPVRKKIFKILCKVSREYPTKSSVQVLAWQILEPLNTGRVQPESSVTVSWFIENTYLPAVKETLRPSTYKDYRNDCYLRHVKSRLGDIRVRDFRAVNGQRIIAAISRENPDIGHKTLMRVKSFMSGAFKHAKREGLIDFENPMRDVSVPGRAKKFKGAVYTMREISEMMSHLSGTAAVVVALAAFTGLRHAELRGLRWGDYDGASLKITRTVWRTFIGETKTPESEGSVPVLPILGRILNDYKTKVGGKDGDWIFKGEKRGTSLNLANLVRRVINPMLTESSVKFRGWHSFRRSLASNLYSLGVKPKVIQAILRHQDIGTTLKYYVETPDAESREALDRINELAEAIADEPTFEVVGSVPGESP